MEVNAKCPKCNGEYFDESTEGFSVCPHCGNKIDSIRVRKYYSAFHDKAGIKKEVHGHDYFKFNDYLRVGSHHLEKGEFDSARQAYLSATEMNPADYRAYMGLVAVETKNYTDLKNTTHKQYLQRALAVANDEQKKYIADSYRVYKAKSEMSDEEYKEYLDEKQKDFKSRIKKAIIGFSQVNDASRKKAKLAFIFTWVMIALGLITFVLGYFFNTILLAVGVVLAFSSYALIIVWQRQRFNDGLYAFLVELFNGLKNFSLSYDQTDMALKFMSSALLSVKNGDPSTNTERIIEGFVEFVLESGCNSAITFIKVQKLTAKYIKG
jgi:tetratricopeptide (TPR) repeat protein